MCAFRVLGYSRVGPKGMCSVEGESCQPGNGQMRGTPSTGSVIPSGPWMRTSTQLGLLLAIQEALPGCQAGAGDDGHVAGVPLM